MVGGVVFAEYPDGQADGHGRGVEVDCEGAAVGLGEETFGVEGGVEELLGVLGDAGVDEDGVDAVEGLQGEGEGVALGAPGGYVGWDVEEARGGEEGGGVDAWAVGNRGLEVKGDDVVGWVQGVDEVGGGETNAGGSAGDEDGFVGQGREVGFGKREGRR